VTTAIAWFRRDLRLADHPALNAAVGSADQVLPTVVIDPALARSGQPRTERFLASVAALAADLDGALTVCEGDPRRVVRALAAKVGASEVHVTGETTPYGRARDAAVAGALEADGRRLVATGTPYAVDPGRVLTGAREPYQVFTPWSRAWREHGWPGPVPRPEQVTWHESVGSRDLSALPALRCGPTAEVGEAAALRRWRAYVADGLRGYETRRDRPDLDATSRMSIPLKYGEIHPRTLLAELDDLGPTGVVSTADRDRLVAELGWREFYADVLWHHPGSAWHDLRTGLGRLDYDSGTATAELVAAWRAGRTGYPLVDAGMRQLRVQGWMHNRVRMVAASFLTKDLHVWWPVGARYFLEHLVDGDLASNSHGWQWVAGTGTDAAPYFRVFNPVAQGRRFDPDGDYVRRWVPELCHLPGAAVHEPWLDEAGYAHGYPTRIVDHAEERLEALARYQRARRR
jgi:deoxyribodipyrimidine photo-lyase